MYLFNNKRLWIDDIIFLNISKEGKKEVYLKNDKEQWC